MLMQELLKLSEDIEDNIDTSLEKWIFQIIDRPHDLDWLKKGSTLNAKELFLDHDSALIYIRSDKRKNLRKMKIGDIDTFENDQTNWWAKVKRVK